MSDPFPTPQGWPETAPKRGMGTGAKVLLILGIVFGGLLLLCCGGFVGLMWWGQSYFKNAMSQDPQVIAAKTQDITEIRVPAVLKPVMALDMTVPFVNERFMLWVAYSDQQPERQTSDNSMLILAAMGKAFTGQDEAQLRQQLDQSMRQQGVQHETLVIENSYAKQYTIRGKLATFQITKGKGENSGAPRIQVSGGFQGKIGPAMLILNADAEKVSEDDAIRMLESIQ